MAIKNNLTIWWGVKRNLLDPWTIWPVKSWPRTWILFVSVSAGQSWSLSNQYPPPPFHSKSVETKPCLWKKVGRNKRSYCINYPNKHALFYITNNGFLDMDDPFSKHCVSCIASTCCLVGLQNFVPAWNAHIIAQKGIPDALFRGHLRTTREFRLTLYHLLRLWLRTILTEEVLCFHHHMDKTLFMATLSSSCRGKICGRQHTSGTICFLCHSHR